MKNKLPCCALTLSVALGISACTVTPPRVTVSGPTVGIWAPLPPPQPRVEIVPPPRYGYLWAPGYWHWESNQHRWIDGRWEQHREHERWVPHRWDRHDRDRWHLNGGHWERD